MATSAFGMGVNKKTLEQSSIFIYQQVLQITYKKLVEPGEIICKSQAISLYQPDDSYILETLLFSDAITTEDIDAFDIGAFTSSKARNTNHIEPKIFIQRTQNNF